MRWLEKRNLKDYAKAQKKQRHTWLNYAEKEKRNDTMELDKTKIAITAIGAIMVIEAIALFHGIDGIALSTSIGLISAITAGTIGFKIGRGE